MSKQTTPQAPRIESRPIAKKAYSAAEDVSNGLKTYNKYHADVLKCLNNASNDIQDHCSYGTISEQAGNIVTQVSRLTGNMRLDLLVKYAARAEVGQAVLDAIMDQLTDEERENVNRILSDK